LSILVFLGTKNK